MIYDFDFVWQLGVGVYYFFVFLCRSVIIFPESRITFVNTFNRHMCRFFISTSSVTLVACLSSDKKNSIYFDYLIFLLKKR